MVLPPSREEFCKLLAAGIARLKRLDALNGVSAPERQERITAPHCPYFVASKRFAALEFFLVLPSPAPYRKNRCKQVGALALDLLKKAGLEGARFRVFTAGVESHKR